MNQGDNNYNQNSNNQTNNIPTQVVKNKFFNFDIDNNDNNDVGATTSGGTNNVISWGVGQKSEVLNDQVNNYKENIETLEDYGINQVNSDVYGSNFETLEEFFDPNINNTSEAGVPKLNNEINSNNINQQNYFSNNQNDMNLNNSPIFAETQNMNNQLVGNDNITLSQDVTPKTIENQLNQSQELQNNSSLNPQGTEWVNHQPLSAASLGGSSANVENQPKDVVEQSRFFDVNIINQDQNKQSAPLPNIMQYGNGVGVVLDDPPTVFDEMSSLKRFIGNDFTKLTMSIFSFSTFIFGSLVFLYRKMFFLGIILTLIEMVIGMFVPFSYAIVAILIIHVVLALAINPMYIKHSRKKVKTILKDKNNMKKNQVEVDSICYKKGKRNLLLALIIFIVCGGLVFAIYSFTNISENIQSGIDSLSGKFTSEETPKVVEKEKEKILGIEDYINITMPQEFTKDDNNYFIYSYATGEMEESSCGLLIDKLEDGIDAQEYIEKIRDMFSISESTGTNVVNDIEWYTISNNSDEGLFYYRTSNIGDISLFLQYKIGVNAQFDVCEENYGNIISSITIK